MRLASTATNGTRVTVSTCAGQVWNMEVPNISQNATIPIPSNGTSSATTSISTTTASPVPTTTSKVTTTTTTSVVPTTTTTTSKVTTTTTPVKTTTTTTTTRTTTTTVPNCTPTAGLASTKAGATATAPCPSSQISGTISATCGSNGVWGAINYKKCVPPCSKYYTVQSGDGCYAIAQANGIPDYTVFAKYNLGFDCNAIAAGDKICIQPCLTSYTIQSGDGCWAVEQKFGISSDSVLQSINPGLSCSAGLVLGYSLCVSACTKWVIQGTPSYNDNCYDIWTNAGLTQAQFMALNPGLNCSTLQAKQAVCVAKSS
ncbi:hypothetical protein HDV00_003112 [Rhizophlyctis rosea]|nr:hypothetical protein HDV00_003112 [Rhizophlyctis rosea]